MTDWRGSFIQSGDTISIVATRDDEGGFGWCVLETVEVVQDDPELFVALPVSASKKNIHHIDTILKDLTDCIICIKGKSDDEVAYYEEYFRV